MPIIKGAFRVKKVNRKTTIATDQYLVLFLEDRLVFARIGGHWTNMTAPKPAKVQEQLRKFSLMRVDEILRLHKHNFQISYSDIVWVKLRNETARAIKTGILQIMTLNEATFDIAPYQDFETCCNYFRSALPGKLDESNIPARSQPDTIIMTDGIPAAESKLPWGITVRNATSQLTTIPCTDAQVQSKNERSVKSGSNWLFMIGGLSVLNSIVYFSGGNFNFLIGLGITQFIAGFTKAYGTMLIPFGAALTFVIAGAFVVFGIFSRKQKTWAFVAGLIVYAVDILLFVWVKDWLSFGFHILAVYFVFIGAAACFRIKKMKRTEGAE